MSKNRRRQAIIDLLRAAPVQSQDDIADAVERVIGEAVTQSTISRDLRELGVIKSPQGYRLPEIIGGRERTSSRASGELATSLRAHAVRVEQAAAMVVVRTAPGHAPLLGSVFDRTTVDGVVGTVAGDDTIFLATKGHEEATELVERLRDLADLN